MAQDKRTFMGGMNKDVDIRLIKNPDYIEPLNMDKFAGKRFKC